MSIPFVPLGPVPESGGATAAEIIAAFKADADLGTSPGGMAANAEAIKAKTDMIGTLRSETRW